MHRSPAQQLSVTIAAIAAIGAANVAIERGDCGD
jgi:hypothetical protein